MPRPPRPLWPLVVALATLIAVSFSAAPSPADDLATAGPSKEAQKAFDKLTKELPNTGIYIVDLTTGEVVFQHKHTEALNPASNAKLLTAFAALRVLGPDHQFLSGLYGQRKGSVVDELVLRSQGDPTLTTEVLNSLAHDLQVAGVRKVGRITVDQSWFDDVFVPPAFDQQPDEWAAFRAPVAAVSVHANTVSFHVRATKDGDNAIVSTFPPGFVQLEGSVKTSSKGEPDRVRLSLETTDGGLVGKLAGTFPEGARMARYDRRVDDPRRLAGYALKVGLERAGIEVEEAEVGLGGSNEKRLLTAHRSAPLAQVLGSLGKDSDNFTAEMLLKALGRADGGEGTSKAGAAVVEKAAKEAGASSPKLQITNGSGLFDANRVTAEDVVHVLEAAASSPSAPEFMAHLAVGGADGTLRNRFNKLNIPRSVRAKTGTLASVVSLSGYVLDDTGTPRYAFSLLANQTQGKIGPARRRIDALITALANATD